MSKIINVGRVTAYADAVKGGYQGTREEWESDLANLGTTAAEVEADRQEVAANTAAVATDKGIVEGYKDAANLSAQASAESAGAAHTDALAATAAKEAAETAQGLAESAKDSAVAAKGGAETAQGAAEAAVTQASGYADNASGSATAAAGSATAAAGSATDAAASATAAAGSADEAEAVLVSIPEDYSTLSNDVTDLKSALQQQADGYLDMPLKPNVYIAINGKETGYNGWSATDFIEIASDIERLTIVSSGADSEYNCFYDQNKTKFGPTFKVKNGKNVITVPNGAKYFRLSNTTAGMESTSVYSYLRSNILDEADENLIDVSSGFSGDVISLNPGTMSEILQANKNSTQVAFIHLSDIHMSVSSLPNLKNIVAFYDKYKSVIDGVVCTGDMQGQKFSDAYYGTVWDANGGGVIMTCIGNHDCTEGGDSYGRVEHTQAEVYAKFIGPYVEGNNPSWGTVAYQENITYWYKDYVDKQTRLVSMNALLSGDEATTQNAWLQNVLADAKTLGYSVIIMTHYGPYNGVKIDSNFTDLENPVLSGFAAMYQQSVQSFIDDGGDFVCYLSGHTHYDLICKNSNYPQQLFVVITSANGGYPVGTKPKDRFNIFTFDKTRHLVKLVRVGQDRDFYMRHIGVISIDYKNLSVVYSD